MKLSLCNIAWDTEKDEKVYNLLVDMGFSGVEISPTRIFHENPYSHVYDAGGWYEELKTVYGLSVPSIQSIWYGRNERLFGTIEERYMLKEYSKKAVLFAEAVNAGNIVFGCPRNRNGYKNAANEQNREIALDFFYNIGEFAKLHNTVIALEANPEIYATDFLNTTEETIHFIEEVDSEGIKLNLDTCALLYYEEPVDILKGKKDIMNHVHISEPGLKKIEYHKVHNKLLDVLMNEGYQGFVSIEMGRQEDISVIKNVMEYIKGVFG